MCAQTINIEEIWNTTFSCYEFVGELHPSRATIGVHTLATLADLVVN